METPQKCATCGKMSSNDYFTCNHNLFGWGFLKKGVEDHKVTTETCCECGILIPVDELENHPVNCGEVEN